MVNGAQEKTRTSTTIRSLAPEASASTNSATWARQRNVSSRATYCCQPAFALPAFGTLAFFPPKRRAIDPR